ncbi:MAPEG family protein [Ciceribacter sp. L1K23]|uniref:MAPEG family protein n=1 Tax=unclassified Ciceribacter TaxID=2628820 RepID=UPI001ABDEBDC|nr:MULTISPECIES: MAPEG family protein [unclassified Ciceribacter]MBO3762469.1 MAPEG family protein [Ciceribacter sp. L1K22]MBR0554174.1 MAPEG family protein [Ciceribacter sp. L1K23]
MEPASVADSPLVLLLAWSVVLLLAHILLQGVLATKELGTAWNAGPRDDERQPSGKLAGRASRASANFQETYPAFVALAAGLLFTDQVDGLGLTGAVVWFVARLGYYPLYLAGVPYIRSIVWLASMAGLGLMFLELVS